MLSVFGPLQSDERAPDSSRATLPVARVSVTARVSDEVVLLDVLVVVVLGVVIGWVAARCRSCWRAPVSPCRHGRRPRLPQMC